MNELVVIDGNFIAHRCRFNGELLRRDNPFAVLHSLLECALDFHECYSGSRIAFVFDSIHSWRKKEFPWYKSARRGSRAALKPEDMASLRRMYDQLGEVRGQLRRCGFMNCFVQNGLEGDDMIADLVRHRESSVVIVSDDKDLYQLLGPFVRIVAPRGNYIGKGYGMEDFVAEYGIFPCQWPMFKAINGCQSDSVPNIGKDVETGEIRFRVGGKTALGYLADSLPHLHPFRRNVNTEWARMNIARNLSLVGLPHRRTRRNVVAPDDFNMIRMKDAFSEFGFEDFLNERWDEWLRFNNENTAN